MSLERTYSKALYEVMRAKNGSKDPVKVAQDSISSVVATIKNSKELKSALFGPVASAKQKSDLMRALCKKLSVSPLVTDFLSLVTKKGRIAYLEKINDTLKQVQLESEGGVLGTVVSADPLNISDVEALSSEFTKKLGKKVEFKTATDPLLLAGLRVTVAGVTYDGSLKSQLERLREKFASRTSSVNS